MRRLQPRKNMPKTTVRDRTHMTAIWTTLMMKRLLSSGAAATKPLSVTTEEKLQQKNSAVLLSKPPSVWFKPVVFISTFPSSKLSAAKAREEPARSPGERRSGAGGGDAGEARWTSPVRSLLEFNKLLLASHHWSCRVFPEPLPETNDSTKDRLGGLIAPASVQPLEEQD